MNHTRPQFQTALHLDSLTRLLLRRWHRDGVVGDSEVEDLEAYK